MARRNNGEEERSMDSLMDAMTNVVGILLLILIVTSLGISAAVEKILANIPDVSVEQLEQMKVSREKTLENLRNLEQTHQQTVQNQIKPEDAAQLKLELEDFEKENKDLADKTSDIDEWKKKVEQEKETKIKKDEKVLTAEAEDRRLAAILAQTPEVEVADAKVIKLPNPRRSEDRDRIYYILCKNQKLYFVGDPYTHVFKIRDVIDQNFTDLAYTTPAIGSYTYSLKGTKLNDARTSHLPLTETFRLTRSAEKSLENWSKINTKAVNSAGKASADAPLLKRLFGNDDKRDFQVHKFRYDKAKIAAFFGDGKLGPADFKYHVSPVGDRLKLSLEPKPEGGWSREQFTAANGEFDNLCRQLQTQRGTVFYYMVSPDSFETYLDARAKSENARIKAGWTVWLGEKFEPKATTLMETVRYNLDSLPAADYKKIAEAVGPQLIAANATEIAEFDARINAAADAAVAAKEITAAEKATFVSKLSSERRAWDVSNLQNWGLNVYRTALAAAEASGQEEVQIELHPPEIPHIRLFSASSPPKKPRPPAVPGGKKPSGDGGSGKTTVILD